MSAHRPSEARRAITVSFRAAPGILAFVNDVFTAIVAAEGTSERRDGFRYDERDRFPIDEVRLEEVRLKADATYDHVTSETNSEVRGVRLQPDHDGVAVIAGDTVTEAADRVADEIVRLLAGATVRDRATGVPRQATAADIAILFRSRQEICMMGA